MTKKENSPVLIIVMGVSGCGKTTLAEHLAKTLHFQFIEADDFHSPENKAHMASGKPLTDTMREPWIQSLCDEVIRQKERGVQCVLAYSGLRRAHRNRFRQLGCRTLFLHLKGPKELIRERMQLRAEHFMPTELLDSQYAALEKPGAEERDIVEIDLGLSVAEIFRRAEEKVQAFMEKPHAT